MIQYIFLFFLVFLCILSVIYSKYIKPWWKKHTKCEKLRYHDGTIAILKETYKPYPWYALFYDIFRIFKKILF